MKPAVVHGIGACRCIQHCHWLALLKLGWVVQGFISSSSDCLFFRAMPGYSASAIQCDDDGKRVALMSNCTCLQHMAHGSPLLQEATLCNQHTLASQQLADDF